MPIYSYKTITFLTLLFKLTFTLSLSPDGFSLLAMKSAISSDPARALLDWVETDPTPCNWAGITCNPAHQVTKISLHSKSLSGYIPSELAALEFLHYLDLSGNNFSGTFPEKLENIQMLAHLDLSMNSINGSLPEGLFKLRRLSGTLNLSFNEFSGEVPRSYGEFPVTLSLDLRYNNLSGKIPQTGFLISQGPTAFAGNPNLCGFPLDVSCPEPEAQNPVIFQNPEDPKNGKVKTKLASKEKLGIGLFLVSVALVVIVVLLVSVWVFRRKRETGDGKVGKNGNLDEEGEIGQKGKFVILDDGFGLELEDLLRASAYVVGKSRSGIVYKVVAGGKGSGRGLVVAVRRLSETDDNDDGKWNLKEFEAEVEAIGKVQHPNIVRLRAYYYADDEKLLISDFVGNGSLYTALHGGPANILPPLSWDMRLKIAQGIARGLAHIHECSPKKFVHKNIKSSKILLDDDICPYISGFGITRFVSGTTKSTNSIAKPHNLSEIIVSPKTSSSLSATFVAPEAQTLSAKFTQKCDVYSFGILLMEILTGRLPGKSLENDGETLENYVRKVFREKRPLSEIIDPVLLNEVRAKTQVITVFHIALNCTELDPEIRPRMRMVCDSLDRVKSH